MHDMRYFQGRPFRAFIHFNRPYFWRYAGGAALALLFTFLELGIPLVMRQVVNLFDEGRMTPRLLWMLFSALIGLGIFAGISRFFQRTLMIGASRLFEYDLRNALFRHTQHMSQDFFHKTKTGDLMARATNDMNYVRGFIGPGIMGTVNMIRLPFTLAVMVYFSFRLTLYGLAPVPFMSLLVYIFVMYMHRQSKVVQEQFSVVSARAQENMAGARVVKAYGASDREIRDFGRETHKYMRENMKLSMVMTLAWPLIEFLVSCIILMIVWNGGMMVIDGVSTLRPVIDANGVQLQRMVFSLGDFSGFLVCLIMLVFPLTEFGWVMSMYQRGAAGMNRIMDVLAVQPAIKDDENTNHSIKNISGNIDFEHVTFGYDPEQPVLHDISFSIKAGNTIALVGPTGSGKSSVVSLLTREYDPQSGVVRIDGHDARHIPIQVLRESLGYVPQDTFLFSDSVRENITFGCPDASLEAIDRACETAQLSETVEELPNRYDTLLGERGVNLSGGQKQRLAIARAIIRDPVILVLDDALSSVDTQTEEMILGRLKSYMASRTSVIISHRVSTVQHADLILVIKDGVIAEQGNHEDLLVHGGLYADMHRRQQLEEEIESE